MHRMRLDRYTFQNDTRCFAELGSEAEAAKVIAELNDAELQRKKLIVRPLKDDFIWGPVQDKRDHKYATRYFFDEGPAAALEAVHPLLEGRRLMVRVQTPGWTSNTSIGKQKQNALRILDEQFAKHGTIERISDFAPFYGDKKKEPRILCFIDFATKEGADKAIENIHDTEIEGRLTWLTRSETNQYRSHQIGKVAPEALKQLQERGVAPKDEELHEDKFVNPLPKKE
ncbi:uncharacterized protein J4E88_000853 [Alternaria novae-zelandiae]|uniref:uncharacterized protein n=1 Tax=Alternaria viburni TaxID=566460 RepID=UPI0020C47447|nr:uncharacterized protein J4E79_006614 [Alternaria viburni]XP_049235019.1 uncharacterized protein J4E87_003470 [Alternaria ethzedia]XP_049260355.1 uncharacterized protein J4E88_000853 [Alternaria novae-zelandiae]KAI4714536.1 hypothetical protein J4E89_000216 [Alternaria sp. Ai002NY15]KAI4629208.1 hypothetical protein J4E87_003470 [Alternaria ethzedia]KAI4658855.1 hypothetical protein J4E79_006614 [Alternaria viburni]KAI4696675.1 hypothetical protein J4E88_000853 [Alternaria novae-zelandiae]